MLNVRSSVYNELPAQKEIDDDNSDSSTLSLVPRDYDVFAGLDVDHHSISATFADHGRLMQSLRLPYSAAQLLNYVRKHIPGQRLAFVYEAGPTGFGLYDELAAAGHPCLVVARRSSPCRPAHRRPRL